MPSCGICVSITFVNSVKTNKHIFKIFSPSGSQAILVFRYQTVWQYSDGNRRLRLDCVLWSVLAAGAHRCSKLSCDEPCRIYNTSRWWAAEFVDGIMAGNNDEVYDKKPQRYAKDNVTQWLMWNLSDSARVILLRLTTDGYKASRGLSATAELLVELFGIQ